MGAAAGGRPGPSRRSGRGSAGRVPGCGRAPAQGRGLFHNRHIAHPPPAFPDADARSTLPLTPIPPLQSVTREPGGCPRLTQRCLEGRVGFAPGQGDPCRQPQGRGPPVLGPGRTRLSAGMLTLSPAWGRSLPSVRSCAPLLLQGPSPLPSVSLTKLVLCASRSPSAEAAGGAGRQLRACLRLPACLTTVLLFQGQERREGPSY